MNWNKVDASLGESIETHLERAKQAVRDNSSNRVVIELVVTELLTSLRRALRAGFNE